MPWGESALEVAGYFVRRDWEDLLMVDCHTLANVAGDNCSDFVAELDCFNSHVGGVILQGIRCVYH